MDHVEKWLFDLAQEQESDEDRDILLVAASRWHDEGEAVMARQTGRVVMANCPNKEPHDPHDWRGFATEDGSYCRCEGVDDVDDEDDILTRIDGVTLILDSGRVGVGQSMRNTVVDLLREASNEITALRDAAESMAEEHGNKCWTTHRRLRAERDQARTEAGVAKRDRDKAQGELATLYDVINRCRAILRGDDDE